MSNVECLSKAGIAGGCFKPADDVSKVELLKSKVYFRS